MAMFNRNHYYYSTMLFFDFFYALVAES